MLEPEREIDFELIAAFIDGRLSGGERQRAVALLAQSEAAFEVYADALRVRADLDGEKVVPIATARRRRGPGGWWAMAPLAAAAVLLVAILPSIQRWRDASTLGAPAVQIASTLIENPGVARGLVSDLDRPRWSGSRGGESRLVDTATAFRLGVRAVDLQVALSAGDMKLATHLTDEMLAWLATVPVSDEPQAHYSRLRKRISTGADRDGLMGDATRAEEATDAFFGVRWYALGKLFAAADLAARTHEASFFATRETARMLRSAIERQHLAPDDVELLRQVAARTGTGMSAEDFAAIQRNFQQLIQRHGE